MNALFVISYNNECRTSWLKSKSNDSHDSRLMFIYFLGQTVEVLKSYVESEYGIPMGLQTLFLENLLMMDPLSLLDFAEAKGEHILGSCLLCLYPGACMKTLNTKFRHIILDYISS